MSDIVNTDAMASHLQPGMCGAAIAASRLNLSMKLIGVIERLKCLVRRIQMHGM